MVPAILNESGEELDGETEGYLVRRDSLGRTALPVLTAAPVAQVFKQPWPGVMRTVYGNHQRFETTYFKKFPGYYVTGDGEGPNLPNSTTSCPTVAFLIFLNASSTFDPGRLSRLP